MAQAETETAAASAAEAEQHKMLAERLKQIGLLLTAPSPRDETRQKFQPVPVEGISVSEMLIAERR